MEDSLQEPDHIPVMVDEVLSLLRPEPGETVLDCTIGRGGHAAAIMPRLAPAGRYIGLDADPGNIEYLRAAHLHPPIVLDLIHRTFADAPQGLGELGVGGGVDGLLADLGFASSQLDDPARGLSFSHEGPLDMRLDPTRGRSAADLVNRLPQRELADLIYLYGEERFSRQIAGRIVDARREKPIETTGELASLCARAYGRGRRSRIDPATRTFQALRIAVNDELAQLEALLDALPELLRPGGRAAIISFHSLEDRRVKHAFRALVKAARADALTKKPLTAGEAERAANPRSRSAKLRGIQWRPEA